MIIVCLVLVLAAFAVIGAALVLAELTLVYVGLGLGGLSAVLLAVETVRIRKNLFGRDRPEPLTGQRDADQETKAGESRTDGLGKASVRATPVPVAVGAEELRADTRSSGEPAVPAGPVPAPVSEPVRAVFTTGPESEAPVQETEPSTGDAAGAEEPVAAPAPSGPATGAVHPPAPEEPVEEDDGGEAAVVRSGASPDEREVVIRLPIPVEEAAREETTGDREEDETAAPAPPAPTRSEGEGPDGDARPGDDGEPGGSLAGAEERDGSETPDGSGHDDEGDAEPAAIAFSEPAEWNPPAYSLRQHTNDEDRDVSAASIAAVAAQWSPSGEDTGVDEAQAPTDGPAVPPVEEEDTVPPRAAAAAPEDDGDADSPAGPDPASDGDQDPDRTVVIERPAPQNPEP